MNHAHEHPEEFETDCPACLEETKALAEAGEELAPDEVRQLKTLDEIFNEGVTVQINDDEPFVVKSESNPERRWTASIERPTPQSIECVTFGDAMRAGDGLQRIAYANGYGVAEYGHPVYPVVTISEINR